MAKAPVAPQESVPSDQASISELTKALTEAIQITQPEKRKTIFNRKKNTPWTPKDGSPKLKLKRKFYVHSILQNDKMIGNDEIELINKLKVGEYCGGWVKVNKRNDGGINIDWPHRTQSQRQKLTQLVGAPGLVATMQRCIAESANPAQYKKPEDDE